MPSEKWHTRPQQKPASRPRTKPGHECIHSSAPPSPTLENQRSGLGNLEGLLQSEMPAIWSCDIEMRGAEAPAITPEGHTAQQMAEGTTAELERGERPQVDVLLSQPLRGGGAARGDGSRGNEAAPKEERRQPFPVLHGTPSGTPPPGRCPRIQGLPPASPQRWPP